MGRLSDILSAGDADRLRQAFDAAEAAEELTPLPRGEYVAHIVAGELATSKAKGTVSYKLTFCVCDGEFAGRKVWYDVWLTPASMERARRELGKLGVTSFAQLERPLPQGVRCRCNVVVHRSDAGAEFNKVLGFDVVGVDPPAADEFAPGDEPASGVPF